MKIQSVYLLNNLSNSVFTLDVVFEQRFGPHLLLGPLEDRSQLNGFVSYVAGVNLIEHVGLLRHIWPHSLLLMSHL